MRPARFELSRTDARARRAGLDRREALALLASGAAFSLASCGKPREQIVPWTEGAEGAVAGEAVRYATALPLGGYGRGVLAVAVDGRPIRIEGNPRHPASLGAADVFAEAEVLSLYDPARARSVETADGPSSWSAFQGALLRQLATEAPSGGAGLTLLTGRVTSPTEVRLIQALQARFPSAKWRRWEPVHDDAAREGARLAFGRPLELRPRLAEVRAVLCLDADPLGPGPDQVAHARAFAAGRKPEGAFARWYVAEPGWSLTGMNADHRLPLRPELIGNLALAVARTLGADLPAPPLDPGAARFAAAVATDLQANSGAALVLCGRGQPAEVHALCHWINDRLSAPLDVSTPADPHPQGHGESLAALADDLHAGQVRTLVAIGVNPAYAAPAELGLTEAIGRVAFSACLGGHPDETAGQCQWRLPLSHPLESWGDLRWSDGTASIVQPLIRPLHDTRTAAELLAMIAGEIEPAAYALVRQTWAVEVGAAPAPGGSRGGGDAGDDDARWKAALVAGTIGQQPPPLPRPAARLVALPARTARAGLTLHLRPDPSLYDGSYAENAWLQECPKPLTHEVWGASLEVSPADAHRLGVETGDHLRLSRAGASVELPVRVQAGQAEGVLSGFIGSGRRAAGPIGTAVGADLAPLRSLRAPWTSTVTAEKVAGRSRTPTFSETRRVEGEARELAPMLTLAEVARPPPGALDTTGRPPSLYPEQPRASPAWAMVIDTAACIGCNACIVACQAENNIPVVGPEETARGRDMHWLRIDAYDVGPDPERPQTVFQPVPCMHCEHAPCEPVCPVEASVHDHEGLNAQVYNRCVGTRFCESNCPYKVRRFNFHGYAQGQPYANMGEESVKAQRNPEVTVRARGVMEKCTYCVQRISAARRTAEKENRAIADGEVRTACQVACPTEAIRFGDLARPASAPALLRADPRHYALLGELGTRPRTTYLARVRNPNPALEGQSAPEKGA